jgi:hypothetical protein
MSRRQRPGCGIYGTPDLPVYEFVNGKVVKTGHNITAKCGTAAGYEILNGDSFFCEYFCYECAVFYGLDW